MRRYGAWHPARDRPAKDEDTGEDRGRSENHAPTTVRPNGGPRGQAQGPEPHEGLMTIGSAECASMLGPRGSVSDTPSHSVSVPPDSMPTGGVGEDGPDRPVPFTWRAAHSRPHMPAHTF